MLTTDYYLSLDHFLIEKGWKKNVCHRCEGDFYFKKESDCCQSLECCGGYPFLTLPAQGYSLPQEVYKKSTEFFSQKGLVKHPSRNLINGLGETLFVIAGAQILEETLFEEKTPPPGAVYVAQPCFRTQFLKSIDYQTIDSCYAFVNLATEEVNAGFESFLGQVDQWLGFLSKMGFYAGNLALAPKIKDSNWGTGNFSKIVIDFNYFGLQLGTASYCPEVSTKGGDKISISDIGFGLERITWAMNKTPDIHDSLEAGIEGMAIDKRRYDLIRTLTLLSMSGLQPSNHNQGYRFRFLAKKYVDDKFGEEVPDKYVAISHDYWARFFSPEATIQKAKLEIDLELQIHFNASILRQLQLTASEKLSRMPTSHLWGALLSRGITASQLKSAIKEVKNV